MRYFFDTEFNERPGLLELIAVGIVDECGRELYAEVPWEPNNSNAWVRDNVWPHLTNKPIQGVHGYWTLPKPNASLAVLRANIIDFVGDDPDPKFYAYYGAYDWVLFCWIFGRMIELPNNFPKHVRDLKQTLDVARLRIPDELRPESAHNALGDAHFNRRVFGWLNEARPDLFEPQG